MAIPGYGTAIGVIARIIDTLWPTKKSALVDKLASLNFKYRKCLIEGKDTEAAVIRKQMQELRRKAEFDAD